ISRACEAKRKEAGKRREVREAGSDPERAWDTPPGCNLLEPSALNPPALGPFSGRNPLGTVIGTLHPVQIAPLPSSPPSFPTAAQARTALEMDKKDIAEEQHR